MSFQEITDIKSKMLLDSSRELHTAMKMRNNANLEPFLDMSLQLALADVIVSSAELDATHDLKKIWGEYFEDYSRDALIKHAEKNYEHVIEYHEKRGSNRVELYKAKLEIHCKQILSQDSVDELRNTRDVLLERYKAGEIGVGRFLLAAQVRICKLTKNARDAFDGEDIVAIFEENLEKNNKEPGQWIIYNKKIFKSITQT